MPAAEYVISVRSWRRRRNYDSALVKRALHPRGRKEGPTTVEAIWPQNKREWNADFVWDGIFISFSTRLSAKYFSLHDAIRSILCTDLLGRLLCSLCSHSAIGHGTRPIIGGAVVFLFLNKLNNRSLPSPRLYPAPLPSPRPPRIPFEYWLVTWNARQIWLHVNHHLARGFHTSQQ